MLFTAFIVRAPLFFPASGSAMATAAGNTMATRHRKLLIAIPPEIVFMC